MVPMLTGYHEKAIDTLQANQNVYICRQTHESPESDTYPAPTHHLTLQESRRSMYYHSTRINHFFLSLRPLPPNMRDTPHLVSEEGYKKIFYRVFRVWLRRGLLLQQRIEKLVRSKSCKQSCLALGWWVRVHCKYYRLWFEMLVYHTVHIINGMGNSSILVSVKQVCYKCTSGE